MDHTWLIVRTYGVLTYLISLQYQVFTLVYETKRTEFSCYITLGSIQDDQLLDTALKVQTTILAIICIFQKDNTTRTLMKIRLFFQYIQMGMALSLAVCGLHFMEYFGL